MRAAELGVRDGWTCWLCDQPVDPDAAPGTPAAPTVDHVVPRSRGGRTEAANLRLAHRRCNGRRGSHLPELDWPDSLAAVDSVPLWQAIARLSRRSGSSEVVALVPTRERAETAARWAVERASRFVGGTWSARVTEVGFGLHTVALRLDGEPVRSAGRPRVSNPRKRRR